MALISKGGSRQLLVASKTLVVGEEVISLVRLKALVQQLLPPNSTVRALILTEEDELPAGEAYVKFEVYDKLLLKELGS